VLLLPEISVALSTPENVYKYKAARYKLQAKVQVKINNVGKKLGVREQGEVLVKSLSLFSVT